MMTLLLTTARIARSLAAAAAAKRQRRQTYRSLSVLDDRTLHDIGLHRTMLLGVSMHCARTARDFAPPASSHHTLKGDLL